MVVCSFTEMASLMENKEQIIRINVAKSKWLLTDQIKDRKCGRNQGPVIFWHHKNIPGLIWDTNSVLNADFLVFYEVMGNKELSWRSFYPKRGWIKGLWVVADVFRKGCEGSLCLHFVHLVQSVIPVPAWLHIICSCFHRVSELTTLTN